MNIALFGNSYQEKYKSLLKDFVKYLIENDTLMIESEFASYLKRVGLDINGASVVSVDDFQGAELAISIGGDGTLLSKAALLARTGTPVVGINTGHLGYLAACRIAEAPAMVEKIKSGDYRREERTMLQLLEIDG